MFVNGSSPIMRAVEAAMKELAEAEVPVLIVGERGVGKCSVAQEIHRISTRRDTRFGRIDRAPTTTELEQLGITSNGGGSARYGTLFFAEIGDSSRECQGILLEALKGTSARGWRSRPRVICGTSRNLEADVYAGRFREDFHCWVSRVCLRIPPLRQRKEDVPDLLDFFLTKHSTDLCRPKPVIRPGILQLLLPYSWPGNVGELEAASRAIVECGDAVAAEDRLERWLLNSIRPANVEKISLKQVARNASSHAERELILEVLTRTHWNRKQAAQELQVSYKALLYKLKQTGLEEHGAS